MPAETDSRKSRERILARLRAVSAPATAAVPPVQPDANTFADLPKKTAFATQFQLFSQKLSALSGEVHLADNLQEAAAHLEHLLAGIGDGNATCIVQKTELIDALLSASDPLAARCRGDSGGEADGQAFAEFAAGISAADFLVARTGSVVLRSTSAGGRRLSVLPPLHIVLARQAQLVPSLDNAIRAYEKEGGTWSYAAIITGPSRTADIQKNLVLGAHGPKRLVVLVVP